jgi:hypothetical protein
VKRRRFAALSIFLVLAASAPAPAPAAGPVDPKTKKPFEDTADPRATRGSEMATLYAEASRALAGQVSAAQAQEAASKRPVVLQTFTQATSGAA